MKSIAKVDMTHVPYKGSGPAVTDVISGQVPMMFDTMLVVGPHIKGGKLRAVTVASGKRLSALPDVPTAAEAGVKGFEVSSWQAIFAPAKTPKPVVERLNTEIAAVLKMPDVQARLTELAVDPEGGPPEKLAEYQKAEIARWAKVVKEAGVKPD